jgi:adenosylmethionine-8-amino-7-oxononanoate aminotransferase
VEDREAKQPFDSGHKFAARLKANAFEAGLICYPMSGTRDGKNGDHVLLAPPFIIEDNQLDELIEKLDTAITATLGQHT